MSRYWDDDATMRKRLWQAVAIAATHDEESTLDGIRRAKQ